VKLGCACPINPFLWSRIEIDHKPTVKQSGIHLDNIVVIIGVNCRYNTPTIGKLLTIEATIKTDLKDCLKNVLAGAVKLVKEENTLALRIARPPVRLKEGRDSLYCIKVRQTLNITDLTLRKTNIEEFDVLLQSSLLDYRGLTDTMLCAKHDGLIEGHFAENTLSRSDVHDFFTPVVTIIELE
jgi:hypothetical protein